MNSDKLYDVLIVGAGPVGLATAIALYTRGITNILVIDQTHSFSQVGQVVDILPNGLKALNLINQNAYEQIKSVGIEFTQGRRQQSESNQSTISKKRYWYQKDLQGNIIRSVPLDFDYWLERYGEGRVSIPWYSLQTTLRELLPADLVRANHRCIDVIHGATSVVVKTVSDHKGLNNPFAHWREDKTATDDAPTDCSYHQFKAKLIVAADGINSTIRKVIYRGSALEPWSTPHYSGYGAIGCLQIDQVADALMQGLNEKYFKSQSVVTLRNPAATPQDLTDLAEDTATDAPRLMLLRRDQNSLGYLLHLPLDLEVLQNSAPKEVVELAIKRLTVADFPAILGQVVALADLSQLIRRPYYIHPANIAQGQTIWSRGRVVLVGDAAHGMPPFAAQGANQGLEDAAMVGGAIATIITNHHLDNETIIAQQFNHYEQLRRPFMEQIQDATLHSHNWSQSQWMEYSDTVYSRDLTDLINQFERTDQVG